MKDKAILAVDLGATNIRVGKIQGNEIIQRSSQRVPTTDSDRVVLKELIASHPDGIRSRRCRHRDWRSQRSGC